MVNYSVYCDGGARGNPGPAGIGFVVFNSRGKPLTKAAKFIGEATNNVAEYWAVIEALKWFKGKIKSTGKNLRIKFFLDSMLVVNQLNGFFKIKNSGLRNLIVKVREKEGLLAAQISYHFVPREENQIADNLVNRIIDKNL
jgi:ribonuclease HI